MAANALTTASKSSGIGESSFPIFVPFFIQQNAEFEAQFLEDRLVKTDCIHSVVERFHRPELSVFSLL